MASWSEIEAQTPELAARARTLLDARVHKTLATLRRDGSPRISGTEVILSGGELWIGSMWLAVKALDLRRDPRFALHSGSDDPPAWSADAKLGGTAHEVDDPGVKREVIAGQAPPGPNHLFRLDVSELSVVRLGEPPDHLVIDHWREGEETTSRIRR